MTDFAWPKRKPLENNSKVSIFNKAVELINLPSGLNNNPLFSLRLQRQRYENSCVSGVATKVNFILVSDFC